MSSRTPPLFFVDQKAFVHVLVDFTRPWTKLLLKLSILYLCYVDNSNVSDMKLQADTLGLLFILSHKFLLI